MSRWDSAAIVPNTRELLPEPETPVNTVSRRLGISRLMSLRLFWRAPCTRIRSWLSAGCSACACASVLVAVLVAVVIVSPSLRRSGWAAAPCLPDRRRAAGRVAHGRPAADGRCDAREDDPLRGGVRRRSAVPVAPRVGDLQPGRPDPGGQV